MHYALLALKVSQLTSRNLVAPPAEQDQRRTELAERKQTEEQVEMDVVNVEKFGITDVLCIFKFVLDSFLVDQIEGEKKSKQKGEEDGREFRMRDGAGGTKGLSCEDTQLYLTPSARKLRVERVGQIVVLEAAMLDFLAGPSAQHWNALHFL